MQTNTLLKTYINILFLILLNFISGMVMGFISFVIAAGWALFYYGNWNKLSIAFMLGAITGFILFLCVLTGFVLMI